MDPLPWALVHGQVLWIGGLALATITGFFIAWRRASNRPKPVRIAIGALAGSIVYFAATAVIGEVALARAAREIDATAARTDSALAAELPRLFDLAAPAAVVPMTRPRVLQKLVDVMWDWRGQFFVTPVAHIESGGELFGRRLAALARLRGDCRAEADAIGLVRSQRRRAARRAEQCRAFHTAASYWASVGDFDRASDVLEHGIADAPRSMAASAGAVTAAAEPASATTQLQFATLVHIAAGRWSEAARSTQRWRDRLDSDMARFRLETQTAPGDVRNAHADDIARAANVRCLGDALEARTQGPAALARLRESAAHAPVEADWCTPLLADALSGTERLTVIDAVRDHPSEVLTLLALETDPAHTVPANAPPETNLDPADLLFAPWHGAHWRSRPPALASAALEQLMTLRSPAVGTREVRARLAAWSAYVAAARNDFPEARRWVEQVLRDDAGVTSFNAMLAAAVELRSGDRSLARSWLQRVPSDQSSPDHATWLRLSAELDVLERGDPASWAVAMNSPTRPSASVDDATSVILAGGGELAAVLGERKLELTQLLLAALRHESARDAVRARLEVSTIPPANLFWPAQLAWLGQERLIATVVHDNARVTEVDALLAKGSEVAHRREISVAFLAAADMQ